MKKLFILLWLAAGMCILAGAAETPAPDRAPAPAPLKYIFYFIGDGMGFEHLTMTRDTGKAVAATAALDALPWRGTARTNNVEGTTTDSAAAGTALACGFKTRNGRIAMLPDGTHVDSIAKLAKFQGRAVAIITSDALNGATPSAFYAHSDSRKKYDEIARWLPVCTFDYLAGSRFNAGDETRAEVEQALRDVDYTLVTTREELQQLGREALPVVATHKWENYAADISNPAEFPRLADYTGKAIELLADNPAGFLIVVEGARIDWGSHANDAVATIGEVREFNAAVTKALDFFYAHPTETLIVVTADHNTGAPQLDGPISPDLLKDRRTHQFYAKALQASPTAEEDIRRLLDELRQEVGEEAEKKALEQLITSGKKELPSAARITAFQQARRDREFGIHWTTRGHAPAPVPVMAIGPGAETFAGTYENTEIPQKISRLMGIISPEH